MKVKDLKTQFERELEALYTPTEIDFIFSIFLKEIFNIDNASLYLKEVELLLLDLITWESSIEKLKQGVPYQYVLGSTEFYGLKLKLNAHTLIPRPETEELLDLIAHENLKDVRSIGDFGCGSGCIGLGLKKVFPNAHVMGFDISTPALAIAKENSQLNNLKVDFSELDILNFDSNRMDSRFDLIVSNPPYVRDLEKGNMDNSVLKFEPHQALFVEDINPLIFYKAIKEIGGRYLNPNGCMYFEINQYLGIETENLFKSSSWKTKLIRDMSSNLRFLKVWK